MPHAARLHLLGWATSDGATHVPFCGTRGSIPPQLVPERLGSCGQRRRELVRGGEIDAEQPRSASDQLDWRAERWRTRPTSLTGVRAVGAQFRPV